MNTKIGVMTLMLLAAGVTYVSAAGDHAGHVHEHGDVKAADNKFCPVCGPEEKMEELSISYKFEGKKYAFCSMGCMKEFKKNPQVYLKEDAEYKKHL